MKSKIPVPPDIAQALSLVTEGKLFELQRWIAEGKRLRAVISVTAETAVFNTLRLLLYVPGAADRALVAELCRTPVIQRKIYEGDRVLGKEIDELLAETRAG